MQEGDTNYVYKINFGNFYFESNQQYKVSIFLESHFDRGDYQFGQYLFTMRPNAKSVSLSTEIPAIFWHKSFSNNHADVCLFDWRDSRFEDNFDDLNVIFLIKNLGMSESS